jgi:pimeloyl-ACP methyl ester carboxylesterase
MYDASPSLPQSEAIPPSDSLSGQRIFLRTGIELQVCYHPGHDPAIIFLHGGLGNRFNWRSQYKFFCDRGYTVLAYDLAGHGQSDSYSRYSLGRHRRDLTRLLNYFHIQSPILCCHSYGVPIGLEWAKRQEVRGLILIAGGTHNLAPWWEIPLMRFFQWGGRYLYYLPGFQQLTDLLSSEHQGQEIKQLLAECPAPLQAHPYAALEIFWQYNFFRRSQNNIAPQVPVLVISGGRDPMFSQQMGEELACVFPLGEHLHFADAGHLLIAEYPDIVNTAILEWMENSSMIPGEAF